MGNLYSLKNKILKEYASEVSPMEFYRDMFPIGAFEAEGYRENGKANGILCSIKDGVGRHSLIFDDLTEIENHLDDEFVITSPIAYFGRRRTVKNASLLYGICFDLDDVGEDELRWILDRLENPHFPRATYIANSGNGIHLYYLLENPIPLYKSIHKKLNDLKHDMTDLIWNKYTSKINSKEKQYQGIFQGFRMVGSPTKNGEGRITVFKTGEKVDIDFLNRYVAADFKIKNLNYESSLTLDEAKEKYPDWYKKRIVDKKAKGRWIVKRDLYDWWIRKIQTDEKLSVGHRYFCIAVLASYAVKCGISEDELRKDAYALIPFMNELQDDFTVDDVESALNFYQESFVSFPRYEVQRISGLDVPANKRNGRKQGQHLARARAVQSIDYPNGEWRVGNGRKPKSKIVEEWRKNNLNGTKAECIKETGLSKPTVYKWWPRLEDIMEYSRYVLLEDLLKLPEGRKEEEAERIMAGARQIAKERGISEEEGYAIYRDLATKYYKIGKYTPKVFEGDPNMLQEVMKAVDGGARTVEIIDPVENMCNAFDLWLQQEGYSKK